LNRTPAANEIARMNLPEADQGFLRDLVKSARQRPQTVRWVDRDGSDRVTTLSAPDAARLDTLARQLGLSREAVLREAAHLPVAKRPPANGAV
jgi:hypothetical protein